MASAEYSHSHRRTRKQWARVLAEGLVVQCGCLGQCRRHDGRCRTTISHGSRWHLGHAVARTHGGGDDDSQPWCIDCNLVDAANITNDRRRGGWSRDW